MKHRRGNGLKGTNGRDSRRRRIIRRVLIAWIALTLIAGMFYAYGKARMPRSRTQGTRKVAG